MKKIIPILAIVLSVIIIAVAAIVLITRDDSTPDNTHTHEFGEWFTAQEPSTTAEGVSKRECECGESETKPIAKLEPSVGFEFSSRADGTCVLERLGHCTDTKVIIPEISPDGDRVTAISYFAFKNAENITEVIIPDSVKAIHGHAFSNCTSLKKVTFGAGVTNIPDGCFSDCSALEEIMIPEGIQSIGEFSFSSCQNLKRISLPNSLTHVGYLAFWKCDALDFNTYGGAKYLGNATNPYLVLMEAENSEINACDVNANTKFIYTRAFQFCNELTKVTLPEGLIAIMENAFQHCNELTSIEIPASVTELSSNAFNSCYHLEAINVDQNNTAYRSIDGTVYTKDGTTLVCYATANPATTLVIPDTVKHIAEYAFDGARSLEYVVLPDGLETIGESAFSLCGKLAKIEIPEKVTTISSFAFSHCESLKFVFINKNVTKICSYAFSSSDALTDVYYEGNESEWLKITVDDNNQPLETATIHYNSTPNN